MVLVEGCENFLGEREDVVRNPTGGVREWRGVFGREVVRGTVNSESAEIAGYFGFGPLLIGKLRELFELGIGGRGIVGEHGGSAGEGAGGRSGDGADGWVVFRL